MPSFIITRLPVRLRYDNNYFDDPYQGIPAGGYTQMVERILEGIPVELGKDYLKDKEYYDSMADRVVYTGPIDTFLIAAMDIWITEACGLKRKYWIYAIIKVWLG